MKRMLKTLALVLAGTTLLSTISCKADLVPGPKKDGTSSSTSGYGDSILPPANVTASQGNYRAVTLSWDTVKNATQYQIFAAETPFNDFVQIGETAGAETTFTEDESTGISRYYYIKSVNTYETASSGSKIVCGTTMDVPIITEIAPDDSGNQVTVHWWMGNCSENTYASQIKYVVNAYYDKDGKNKVPDSETEVPGTENHCTVNGLSPRSDYYFTVSVKNLNMEQNSEVSDITNAQTAHKVIPMAAQDLEITKGTNKDQIELTWTVPEFVDYLDKSTKQFSIHPVYFTIERKLAREDESAYKVIAKRIGTTGAAGELHFDCSNNTTSSAILNVTGNTEGETNPLYPAFVPGSKLTYIDKADVVKGRQYTYRITSYTDIPGTEKITGESSVVIDDGWRLSEPNFTAESILNINETSNTEVSSVDVTFSLDFEDYEEYFAKATADYPYNFVITYVKESFTGVAESEVFVCALNSTADVNQKQLCFENPAEEEGSYTYKLYIVKSAAEEITSIPSEYIDVIPSSDKVTVVEDATKIPEIKNFTVKDGYKNKYILSWDSITDAEYTVYWTDYEYGESVGSDSKKLESTDYSTDGSTVTFVHSAESGNSRRYTLKATKNEIPDTEQYAVISKTLGTAVPVMEAPDYKTITVKWESVQMATAEYEIAAAYDNSESVITADNYEITEDPETNMVTCVITEPKGFDNINKSGLPVSFTVTAKNTETSDTTQSEVLTVRTLGPALINAKAVTKQEPATLSVKWDEVAGATGYVIYRTKYKLDSYTTEKSNWAFENADYYYCSLDGKLKESGTEIPGKRAKVTITTDKSTLKNSYTLVDYDCDADDDTSSYELNQAKIRWGTPYGYIVLPIKGDASDFIFGTDSSDYLKVTEGNSGVIYSSKLNEQQTSTYGYGLNVRAAKSESASKVKVTWAKPSNSNLVPTIYRMPFSKEENHEYGSSWTWSKKLTAGDTSFEDKLEGSELSKAFVYAVQYEEPNTSNFNTAYRKALATTMENTETQNKGYLMTLEDFTAEYGGNGSAVGNASYYQENLTWKKYWDYEERAVAPESFTIDIKNRNLSSTMDWSNHVASGNITAGEISVTAATGYADTTIATLAAGNGITLKPTGLTAGTAIETNDILKVLRDAKHYYSVNLTRGDITVRQAEDNSVYAYRQISPEELSKCVSLIIADAIYKAGIPNRKTYTVTGEKGTFKLACSTDVIYANYVQWEFTNFCNNFTKTCNSDTESLPSFLTLHSTSSVFNENGIKGETLYYLPKLDITISSEVPLDSYKSILTYIVGVKGTSKKFSLSITKGDKSIISISESESEFLKWFPYDIGSKHISPDSTVNTALKTYQAPWWN